jgi:hypothetical protein
MILSKWELEAATLQVDSLKLRSVCCAEHAGVPQDRVRVTLNRKKPLERSTYHYRELVNVCHIFNVTAGSCAIVLEGRIVDG